MDEFEQERQAVLAVVGRLTTEEHQHSAEHGERSDHSARGSLEVMCDREYDSRPVSPLSWEPVAHAYSLLHGPRSERDMPGPLVSQMCRYGDAKDLVR